MPTVKLTARTTQAARPPASGRRELFDEDLPAFCIRITPNGRRTACILYRVGSRLRRATLGTLPPLSLAEARDLARAALRSAALGGDPASAKREAREALTVAALVKDYVDAGEGCRSDATNDGHRRTLKAVVTESPIAPQAARQVVRGELRAFLEPIARKTPIRANRVLALVRAASRWGLREAVLENGKTLPRLVVGGAVKLLLLLGTRRSETLNMRWADVDEHVQTWTVPGTSTVASSIISLSLALLRTLRLGWPGDVLPCASPESRPARWWASDFLAVLGSLCSLVRTRKDLALENRSHRGMDRPADRRGIFGGHGAAPPLARPRWRLQASASPALASKRSRPPRRLPGRIHSWSASRAPFAATASTTSSSTAMPTCGPSSSRTSRTTTAPARPRPRKGSAGVTTGAAGGLHHRYERRAA